MATFKSFTEVAAVWKSKYRVSKVQVEAIELITKHVQKDIQNKHGKTGPSNHPLTIARKGGNSPMMNKGLLKASVFRMAFLGKGTIWQGIDWLGRIHEYGATFKMTERQRRWLFAQMDKHGLGGGGSGGDGYIRIPPRPIWRTALQENRLYIYKLAYDTMKKYLTN